MAGNGITASRLEFTSYNVSSVFGSGEYTSLISGYQWGIRGESIRISYSFPGQNGASASHIPNYEEYSSGWSALNSAQIRNVRLALEEWEDISNIDFYEVVDNQQGAGDIRFAFSADVSDDAWGHAYYPTSSAVGGDVWINDSHSSDSFAPGSYNFIATLHEIGHAIGLRHPHATNSLSGVVMSDANDNVYNTVMSYDHASLHAGSLWPSIPGRFDNQAIDALYGTDRPVAVVPDEVYRFYNTATNGHFFTASEAERDHVISTIPQFRYEGIGYYAFATDQGPTTEEVYRFYNTATNGHFFTASEAERDHVISTIPQFRYEGIAFYAPDDGATLMI